MSFYIESPFDPIVDVHWKKKKDDEPPDPAPPLCNIYGWGLLRTEHVHDDPNAVVPYGPHVYPPMTGTFRTYGNYGPDGRPLGGIAGSALAVPQDYLTTTEGLTVNRLTLLASSIGFGTDYLTSLDNADGGKGVVWEVPMVGGGTRAGAQVIKGYDINLSWNYPRADPSTILEFGLGLAHPIVGRLLPLPPAPFAILGLNSGASSVFYDFQYIKWLSYQAVANEGNQFDPGLGGPATLFIFVRNLSDDVPIWATTYGFGPATFFAGDYFAWEIAARCQPLSEAF